MLLNTSSVKRAARFFLSARVQRTVALRKSSVVSEARVAIVQLLGFLSRKKNSLNLFGIESGPRGLFRATGFLASERLRALSFRNLARLRR
jgi:hypothetical protein